MERKPRHPSERPVHNDQIRSLGFYRRVPEEPLTPGLRRAQFTTAIGFTARLSNDDED